jgi:hypothetical protein
LSSHLQVKSVNIKIYRTVIFSTVFAVEFEDAEEHAAKDKI